jgi:CheY-like chemotaxis protein
MSQRRIAVVEDNPDNRLLLQALLADLSRIDEYEDGASALQGMLASPPDLVLLDISLPEMDGPEVLKRIRATSTLDRLPVIALTAHAMTGDRERFLTMGFNGYVTKPILDEELLFTAIRTLLPPA